MTKLATPEDSKLAKEKADWLVSEWREGTTVTEILDHLASIPQDAKLHSMSMDDLMSVCQLVFVRK